jgi:hypothetical protein
VSEVVGLEYFPALEPLGDRKAGLLSGREQQALDEIVAEPGSSADLPTTDRTTGAGSGA